MKIITKSILGVLLANITLSLHAEEANWLDTQHDNLKSTLHSWSNAIDSWFGTPDHNKPASAGLRIMFDNEWSRYNGYSFKPRVRGKIKLPTLKQKLNIVFGDEDIDNQSRDKHRLSTNYRDTIKGDKVSERRQARNDNASIALRWSNGIKERGIETDLDLGIRSGSDIFVRAKASKTWVFTEQFSTRLEQIYRYGINSKHYLRTNLENKFAENEKRSITNHTLFQYSHDRDEEVLWGNSLYRQHNYSGNRRLNYGFFVGGEVSKKKFNLNYYGPFINWRQPILKKWLFIQSELNFYNDKKQQKKHHLGVFFRLEAIF